MCICTIPSEACHGRGVSHVTPMNGPCHTLERICLVQPIAFGDTDTVSFNPNLRAQSHFINFSSEIRQRRIHVFHWHSFKSDSPNTIYIYICIHIRIYMYTYTEKPWRLHGFSVYVYIYLSMAIDRHVQPIVVPFCQSQIFIFDFDLYVSFAVFLWFANLKETLDRLRLADLTWEKINVSLWIRSLGLFFSVSLIRKLERDPWQIAFVGSALKKCQCQSLISFSRSLFQCFIIDLHTWKRPLTDCVWQIWLEKMSM